MEDAVLLSKTLTYFVKCEFVSCVFEPSRTAGPTITNGSGSHSWIVYGKKKYLLWLNVKLLPTSFICCLFILVLRNTGVVVAY